MTDIASHRTDVVRVVYGVSKRMDRVGSLGDTVVPQIPEIIGRALMASK